MQPARILPDLQCSLLCDDVRREVNGNWILMGILSGIGVPQLPVTAARLFAFNRWTAGVGQFNEKVRILAPDQATEVAKRESKFALQDAVRNFTSITVFGNVEFKVPGIYFVEVLVDDVMKLRYPLPVVLVQAPPQPGSPTPQTPAAEPGAPAPGPADGAPSAPTGGA